VKEKKGNETNERGEKRHWKNITGEDFEELQKMG
jgi:hypothetical protein